MEATEKRHELGRCDWQAIFVNNPSVSQLTAKVSQKREFKLTTGYAGRKKKKLVYNE